MCLSQSLPSVYFYQLRCVQLTHSVVHAKDGWSFYQEAWCQGRLMYTLRQSHLLLAQYIALSLSLPFPFHPILSQASCIPPTLSSNHQLMQAQPPFALRMKPYWFSCVDPQPAHDYLFHDSCSTWKNHKRYCQSE